jgi:Mg-chelatase subunit ChlD
MWSMTTTSTAIVPGSLRAISQASGKSLAETFASADVVILVDTSGSMAMTDSRSGRARYDVACEELTSLQASMPGKIAVISFSDEVSFCPAGIPHNYQHGTDLVKALKFVHVADVEGMMFILISDGEPDAPNAALMAAKLFTNKIDVIYVGPERSPAGRDFLTRLSKATGGQTVTADRAKELASSVTLLLSGN